MISIESVDDLKFILIKAAETEKKLRNDKPRNARSSWPDHAYDLDDKKDWQYTPTRSSATAEDVKLLDCCVDLLKFLGMSNNTRLTTGKKIIWAKAHGFSFRKIAFVVGKDPTTCRRWYNYDIDRLFKMIKNRNFNLM